MNLLKPSEVFGLIPDDKTTSTVLNCKPSEVELRSEDDLRNLPSATATNKLTLNATQTPDESEEPDDVSAAAKYARFKLFEPKAYRDLFDAGLRELVWGSSLRLRVMGKEWTEDKVGGVVAFGRGYLRHLGYTVDEVNLVDHALIDGFIVTYKFSWMMTEKSLTKAT